MSLHALVGVTALLAARRRERPPSPAALAKRLDPKFVVTPTIALLDDIAVRVVREPNGKDMVNTPPRTGKSNLLAVWTPVWAFMIDPDMEIMIISNGDDLAKEHSGKARKIIMEHADYLGYRISPDKTAVGRWLVEGRKGGMLAAGITSNIVGKGADLLLLDDVIGGASEADSAAHRRRVLNEYQGSLSTRVHPGGSELLVMTRWHEEDIAGSLLEQNPGRWRRTNVTAVGELGVPDALGKAPGVAMISALGFTPEDFADKRRTVGERQWYAQYMGVPSTPAGSLVKAAWFEAWRLPCAPANPVLTVVSVDPADSGKGDECGLVASSLTRDGVVALIADKSGQMTSDQWASAAVQLAADVGASQIAVEGYSARETYSRMVKDAIERARTAGRLRHAVRVTTWPEKGKPRPGDALARSGPLLQALETGTAVLAGVFPKFEETAITWQAGQHQPDRLAAWVVGHDVLVSSAGQVWDIAGPPETAGKQAAAGSVTVLDDWMRQRVG
ncbi:Gp3 [Mycolicibacterium canariasense]|uniref:Gp3 n=1 Tax=Mycolicibacterium canariasense TaxID=228230 RepID=A0A100WII8_MYCCR|nr:terminase family protein [Mycolicibacterium canariasense]MCV7210167.1 hypothetical protein [Mycolicibacterium canariasense]GAS98815.1 Gp3 [Mycolicibacterium canariasense]